MSGTAITSEPGGAPPLPRTTLTPLAFSISLAVPATAGTGAAGPGASGAAGEGLAGWRSTEATA